MQCHHILHESKGGDDSFENCIALCLDCHADQGAYNDEHPIGIKYQPEELRARRDSLYKKVANGELFTTSPAYVDVDRIVFQKLRAALDLIHDLSFLKDSSFASWSFPTAMFQTLWNYLEVAARPESEFLDTALESARLLLVAALQRFQYVIAIRTFPVMCQPERNQIPEIWRIKFPDRHVDAVQDLQESADELIVAYTLMVRLGRRRLAVH